jgi:hypothetical protein
VRVVCDRYRLAKKEPKFESYFLLFAFFRVLGFEILKTLLPYPLVRLCAQ